MKIQTKILLLLFLVIGAFMAGLSFLRLWEVKGIESLYSVEKQEREESFDKFLELKGESLETLAFDYTYWDEMVDFLKTQDKTWASDILDTSLSSYKVDAMWVYRIDGTLVYSVTKWKDQYTKGEKIPLPEESLGKVLELRPFHHFFLNTPQGLMEIRGATIHPSNDVDRKTPPHGYLFVGRLWNDGYMNELSGLTESTLIITPFEESKSPDESADRAGGIISFSRPLIGWDGKPVAQVNVRTEYPFIKELNRGSDRYSLLYTLFSLVIFVLLLIFIMRWVSIPLKSIFRSLDREDSSIIKGLQKDKTEFGQLAQLINRFFEQRDELIKEISERRQTEEALSKAELRYRELIETVQAIVWRADAQTFQFTFVSKEAEILLGYPLEKWLTEPDFWKNHIHPEDREWALSFCREATREKKPHAFEYRMVAADGRVVWLRDIIRVLVENDEPRELIGIMVDLTERKKSEEILETATRVLEEHQKNLEAKNINLSILSKISQDVQQSVDLDTTYRTVLERTADLGFIDLMSLYLVEGEGDKREAVLQIQRGYPEDYVKRVGRIPYPGGYTWKVIEGGELVFYEDASDPSTPIGPAGKALGQRALLSIPIKSERNEVVGVIHFSSPERTFFAQYEFDFLLSLGNQIGTAIVRAKMLKEMKKREETLEATTRELREYQQTLEEINKDLSILSKISQEIHQSIELNNAYRIVTDATKNLKFFNLMALYLVEGEGDRREAVLQLHHGYPDDYLKKASRIAYPKGNTWRVIESGELIYVEDASDPSSPVGPAGKALGQRALLSIPIKSEHNEVIGVIHFSSSERTSFTKQEFDFLLALGTQIGTAIAKARMFEEMKKREEELREREERLRKIFEDGPLGMAIVDLDYRFARVNHTLCQMVGYTEEELTSLRFPDITYPEDIDTDIRYAEQLVRKEITRYKMDKRYIKKNKEIIWVTLTASIILDSDGNPLYYLAMIEDITERKRAEQAIQQSNEKLTASVKELEFRSHNRTLLNEMGDLLQTCLTVEEAYDIIAKFAQLLFPGESGALCILDDPQNNVETVAAWGESSPTESIFAPEDCWALRRGKAHVVGSSGTEPICRHITYPPSDGYLCVPMMSQGKALGTLCLLKSPNNVHQSKEILLLSKESVMQQLAIAFARQVELALANLKLRETLHNQAIRDPLTGLFNRRYMEESLKREIYRAERKGTSLGIIMLDIDHFKRFNDTHGHATGDALLHELGAFLKAHVRGADIACRYGGEEFTLILPDVSVEGARQRAEQLRERVRYLKVQDNNQTLDGVTLSLGVAVSQEVTEETTRRSAIA